MHRLAIVAAAAVLTACGGGSDDEAPTVTTTNPNAAWIKLWMTGGSWTTTGTGSDDAKYEITREVVQTTAPNADSMGQGRYGSSGSSTTVRRNGVVIPPLNTLGSYSPPSADVEATYFNADRSISLTTRTPQIFLPAINSTAPPATAAIGDSGPLYTGDWCSFACGAANNATVRATWSFIADKGVAFFCVNRAEPMGAIPVTTSHCVEVNAAGDILGRARTTISAQGGLTLTARNF